VGCATPVPAARIDRTPLAFHRPNVIARSRAGHECLAPVRRLKGSELSKFRAQAGVARGGGVAQPLLSGIAERQERLLDSASRGDLADRAVRPGSAVVGVQDAGLTRRYQRA
jgi:hypothetical protein